MDILNITKNYSSTILIYTYTLCHYITLTTFLVPENFENDSQYIIVFVVKHVHIYKCLQDISIGFKPDPFIIEISQRRL